MRTLNVKLKQHEPITTTKNNKNTFCEFDN